MLSHTDSMNTKAHDGALQRLALRVAVTDLDDCDSRTPGARFLQASLIDRVSLSLKQRSHHPFNLELQGGAGSNVSDYSHGTGFINWWGWDPVAPDRTLLTNVTAAARRGATVLNVSNL